MRILLIMPPGNRVASYTSGWKIDSRDYGCFPPLGLLYLAACLRKAGFPNVSVVDAATRGLSMEHISGIVENAKPNLVGITSFTVGFGETHLIAKAVKTVNPNIHVCVGGPHVAVFPALTLENEFIDSIIVGEGEAAICRLARAVETAAIEDAPPDGVFTSANCPRDDPFPVQQIEDLDTLPHPARDLLRGTRYFSAVGIRPNSLTVLTSRGCPFQCTFCDVLFKTLRIRSIDDVVDEIEFNSRGRATEIFFYDDTLNISEQRFLDLCDAVSRLRLPWSFRGRPTGLNLETLSRAKRAGCYQIHLGIETLDDDNLRFLKKGTNCEEIHTTVKAARKLGIRTIANLMIGMPFETNERDVLEGIRKAIKLNPYLVQINILQPIPGTELFEQGIARGVVSWNAWEDHVRDPLSPFVPRSWDEHISQDAIGALWRKSYRMFYLRPRKILELFLGIRSWWEVRRKLINGWRMLRG